MSDPELHAPPPREPQKPNKSAVKHQRRPSFHTRRRSQHSIASFGDMADDVIKAPSLGSLGESTKEEVSEGEDYGEVGKVKTTKNKHDRKSSNIHELFGGEDEEEVSMDNILQSLMQEEADEVEDGYSPRAIQLEDAPDTPKSPPKIPSAKARNQSFGGIVDLFGHEELETGISNPDQEVKRLRAENQRLVNELEKSNRIRKQLEQEIDALRSAKGHSSKDEIESIKLSKINLILAAVSEIDRMRNIITTQTRHHSIG